MNCLEVWLQNLASAGSLTASTMPSLHSGLVNNNDHWAQPNLGHAALLAVIGNAANTDLTHSRLALTNLSTHAPTVIAFTL